MHHASYLLSIASTRAAFRRRPTGCAIDDDAAEMFRQAPPPPSPSTMAVAKTLSKSPAIAVAGNDHRRRTHLFAASWVLREVPPRPRFPISHSLPLCLTALPPREPGRGARGCSCVHSARSLRSPWTLLRPSCSFSTWALLGWTTPWVPDVAPDAARVCVCLARSACREPRVHAGTHHTTGGHQCPR